MAHGQKMFSCARNIEVLQNMLIRNLQLNCADGIAKLSAEITWARGDGAVVWFSVPVEWAEWFCVDRYDGFLVAMLHQAVFCGEDIVIDGGVSSKLWHNLKFGYLPMICWAAGRPSIRLEPSQLVTTEFPAAGVVTGFSGGVDSFATMKLHYLLESSADFRINHLLFNNVGSHGRNEGSLTRSTADAARVLFLQRSREVKPIAEKFGVPLIVVDSNVAEVFPINFLKMHHALNAAVPLVLQNAICRYYYASTYKFADCVGYGYDDISRLDPMALHLLSTETLDVTSTGCQFSRVEKTLLIENDEICQQHLNVCVDASLEGKNCSTCFKCARTIFTLERIGAIEKYSDVFDVKKFQSVRRSYIKSLILSRPYTFEREIAEELFSPQSSLHRFVFQLGRFYRGLN